MDKPKTEFFPDQRPPPSRVALPYDCWFSILVYFPHFEQEDEVIKDELWHNCKTKFDKLIEKQKKHVKNGILNCSKERIWL